MKLTPDQIYTQLSKVPQSFQPVDIFVHRPSITKDDNERGEIIRYFCKRSNHPSPSGIIEINKEKYDEIKNNSLYTVVELRWIIRGNISDLTTLDGSIIIRDGVATQNKKAVLLADKTLAGLQFIIIDYLRFWQGP